MTEKSGYTVLILLAVLFEAVFSGCRKDPAEFVLSSLMIGTIPVGASEPEVRVPVGQVISASFNCTVDLGSVGPSSIILVQEHDQAGIPLTLTVSENTITITPEKDLNFGTPYRLTFTAGIKSEGGLSLMEAYRTFTTAGVFVPEGVIAYWNFEGNARDQAGTFNPAPGGVVNIEYAASRNKSAGNAAVFDGDVSIIEIPGADALMNTTSFTLSLWVKANSAGHFNEEGKPSGHFVMGLAAFFGLEFEISDDYSSCKLVASFDAGIGHVLSEDLYFPGDGRNKDNGGWQG